MPIAFRICALATAAVLQLAACAGSAPRAPDPAPAGSAVKISAHRGADDLLSAGLGLEGLRAATPPVFADPLAPTADELRRRAVWSNWRGIADLAPGGGYGEVYGAVPHVPGREFHALRRLPEARHPHRVMLQLPDGFDTARRCLVVTASSGSRGIYGAIALAGAWGLPRGCAVAYTDKGAGTGWFDLDSGEGYTLDGQRSTHRDALEFHVADGQHQGAHRIAFKHAHSQDHPEADWGRHLRQAAEFGLEALSEARPDLAPFTFDNTRVVAVGLSNGAGAALRASEDDEPWLDGVVAVAPNVHVEAGSRPLYDYATEAALLMPCALLDPRFDAVAFARPGGARPEGALRRCAALHAAGLLDGSDVAAQSADALRRLRAAGWSDAALEAGALSVAFDLWRAVGVAYASAYLRSSADAMPCGFSYAALDAQGAARATTGAERAAWWSDTSGIPPQAGVGLIDTLSGGDDPALPALRCLRALWEGSDHAAAALQASVAATRAGPPRAGLPVIVVHGEDDGLIPERFSTRPWVDQARATGRTLTWWRVSNVQHFDAFLGLPPLAARYLPLLPYAYRALDAMQAHLDDAASLPADRVFAARPRGQGQEGVVPLARSHLDLD